jgi:hypothetical protein
LAYSKRAQIFESLKYIHKNYLTASGILFVLTSLREFDHVFMFVCFPWLFSICTTKFFFFQDLQEWQMAKNLLHCETGFGVYRSTQLGHIPLFLLLYLLVGPSIDSCMRHMKCKYDTSHQWILSTLTYQLGLKQRWPFTRTVVDQNKIGQSITLRQFHNSKICVV